MQPCESQLHLRLDTTGSDQRGHPR
jgi:hypothetical protein